MHIELAAGADMNVIGTDHQSSAATGRRALVDLLTRHLSNPVAVEAAATDLLSAGWRPPAAAGKAATVDELEALPPGAVITDPDGHVWVRNRVGEWCEPYPAGIDPIELLVDGPVAVRHIPAPVVAGPPAGTIDKAGRR